MVGSARTLGSRRMTASPSNDQFDELLAGAIDGQSWAFTELYQQFAGRISAFAASRQAPDPDAIANDVMLRVFQNIGSFVGTASNFESWVFTITRNQLIDAHRHAARRPAPADREIEPSDLGAAPSAEDQALSNLSMDDTLRLLDCLTPDQREVIALRMITDLKIEDVAMVIEKPVTAVKALQRRGIARLQREILNKVVSK